MANKETYLGDVQDVNGTRVSISLSENSLSGFVYIDGQGYRVGQIGSFIRIPIGYTDLFGLISQVGASAIPERYIESERAGSKWMTIQLIGEGPRNGVFQRGLSQYPTVGDEVHLVSEKELRNIYGQPDKPYFVKLGHVSNADSIPALVDVNKLITRHSAVVGTTGSGKSTTVASIMNALSDSEAYPSSRIIMLDLHGEYTQALQDRSHTYKIGGTITRGSPSERPLKIPFWALNFDELSEISFGEFNNEKDRNYVMEKVREYKLRSIRTLAYAGVSEDNLTVDTPVPFSLHELWYELYTKTFGTYYKDGDGQPVDKLAFVKDANNEDLRGDPLKGIPPTFRHVQTGAGELKINYLPSIPGQVNLGKQLTLLGSKLRIPRYEFIFKPEDYTPDIDGRVGSDLDALLKDWIGSSKPISILDLSGVPSDILKTTIGALLRLLYEALFWGRELSQGGRHRPLLIVMEEAHIYLNDGMKGMASRVVQRIVKEGRKYGVGAMIVSQRPSEIDTTILSQCGTFFALRLTNSSDRGKITSTISDNLDGLTGMLPILRTGEAIILGESVKLPMRTTIEPPPKNRRPDSQDPIVFDEIPEEHSQNTGGWGIDMEGDPSFAPMVEAWRSQNSKILINMEENDMEIFSDFDSSNIEAIGYDHDSSTLQVEFKKGGMYHYFDVPDHVFEAFKNADSQGKYLANSIKGAFRYSRA